MCGINVIIARQQGDTWITAMNQSLLHRGPDEDGVYRDKARVLSMGSRRLKVIDTAAGRMPFRSPCGRYAMVYNGEIYNHPELKQRVSDYAFSSKSDGEVLFACLQREGLDILKACNGMFSFALWDDQERRLHIGRDRLGIKPLFLAQSKGRLAISSEVRALKTIPGLGLSWNREATNHYFSNLYFSEPASVYNEISRFPAGCTLSLDVCAKGGVIPAGSLPEAPSDPKASLSSLGLKRYWGLSFHKAKQNRGELKTRIKTAFQQAVERRLVSDVPLGVFLSSGIDSTLIAQSAVRSLGKAIECHTMSFEGDDSELSLAQQTADLLKCPLIHHRLDGEQLRKALPQLLDSFSEPFAGGLPLWFLCRAASQRLTVALTGTGGDECFGNYGRGWHLQPELGPWRALKSFLKGDKAWTRGATPLSFALAHGASWSCFYHEKNAVIKRKTKAQWLKGNWGKSTEDWMDEQFWRTQGPMELDDRLMNYDINGQLKDEFLFSQDLLSMAHGMELRVPFCDHSFIELCSSIPSSLRHQKSSPKAWMLEVFAEDIPHHILNQSKRGFRIPYGAWLKGPLRTEMEQAIGRDLLADQGCFDHGAIQKTWQAHLRGEGDHEGCLWALFMFQRWWLRFAEGP